MDSWHIPREAGGRAKMLKVLASPYQHVGVQFIPLGAMNADNAAFLPKTA